MKKKKIYNKIDKRKKKISRLFVKEVVQFLNFL